MSVPVTSRIKGYPFEGDLPEGLAVSGVALSDQLRSLDWRARRATFANKAPESFTEEVLAKAMTLLRDTP